MREGDPIAVGVVGVGYAGSLHAAKYAALPAARLVAVADIDGRRGREVGERHQVPAVTDHHDLLDKVRCVSIAVPTQQHYRVARDFLAAGIDVLVEKPITSTVPDGRKLVDLARENACILQVGHLERFNPVVRALSKVIAAPKFVECHRLAPFMERGTDVDVVLDLMIHDIDVISSLVHAPVTDIDATGVAVLTDKPDIANARIRFDDGCVANVTASRVSMKRERKIRFFSVGCLYFSGLRRQDGRGLPHGGSQPGFGRDPGTDDRRKGRRRSSGPDRILPGVGGYPQEPGGER